MDGSAWPRVSLFFIEFSITTRSYTCSILCGVHKQAACLSKLGTGLDNRWTDTKNYLDADTKIIFMPVVLHGASY